MPIVNELITGMTLQHRFVKLGATSEAAGVYTTSWYLTGYPTSATANTAGVNGRAVIGDSSGNITGMFIITQPKTPEGANYITRIECAASPAVTEIIVADRLWENSGLSTATATEQAITSAAFPIRCPNPTGSSVLDVSGYGAMAAIEVRTVMTNTVAITNEVKLNYTNSDGTAGRTGNIASFPQTAAANSFIPFELASGDKGIKSIEGITLSTASGGTIHLVVYRPVTTFGLPFNGQYAVMDALSLGCPILPSGAVPFIYYRPAATTAQTIHGTIEFATIN